MLFCLLHSCHSWFGTNIPHSHPSSYNLGTPALIHQHAHLSLVLHEKLPNQLDILFQNQGILRHPNPHQLNLAICLLKS